MTRELGTSRPRSIDLAADAGESFGRYSVVDERALFQHLSSVHLACGFHAGDPAGLVRSVTLAAESGLRMGAHPGYPDRVGFGRRHMSLSSQEVFADVVYQLGALSALVALAGHRLSRVKPHGALYNDAHDNQRVAEALVDAVSVFAADLPMVVLAGPGGEIARAACLEKGVPFLTEAFPDRAYLASGSLAPRSMEGALVTDPEQVALRAVAMATGTPFPALGGGEVVLSADTLCLHGDGPDAPAGAAAVRAALEAAGVTIAAA